MGKVPAFMTGCVRYGGKGFPDAMSRTKRTGGNRHGRWEDRRNGEAAGFREADGWRGVAGSFPRVVRSFSRMAGAFFGVASSLNHVAGWIIRMAGSLNHMAGTFIHVAGSGMGMAGSSSRVDKCSSHTHKSSSHTVFLCNRSFSPSFGCLFAPIHAFATQTDKP